LPGIRMTLSDTQAASEARRMLDAFTGVGANRFHVTFTNINEEETDFFKNRTVASMRYNLPGWIQRAARLKQITLPATDKEPEETVLAGENLIIRPYSPPQSLNPYTPPAVVLVQLDDLEQKQLERVRQAAFLILRTSPKDHGFQAWLAVQGGDREFTSRLKRGTGADLSASGSVRMAGTGNYKRAYKADFPSVAIEEVHPGRIVTPAQLESMGLAAPAPEKPQIPSFPLRCSDRPFPLAWPSYERCMKEALARGRKRSSADFTFCCIAIDHFRRTPEETADKLMEVSAKARENGEDYAIGQAMRAAEKVAANPRSRSR
jgi:RepB DNA-primase from phage plasmid